VQDYFVAFDLAEVGYRQWPFAAIGLLFVGVGTLLVRYRKQLLDSSPRWFRSAFPIAFLGFSLIWTTIAFALTYAEYHLLGRALREGRVAVVEGPVENFVPMPYSGHASESFTVGGVRFEYSDYRVTAGFNNTRSHGGPIQAGRLVRITHVGGDIVRLEIRP